MGDKEESQRPRPKGRRRAKVTKRASKTTGNMRTKTDGVAHGAGRVHRTTLGGKMQETSPTRNRKGSNNMKKQEQSRESEGCPDKNSAGMGGAFDEMRGIMRRCQRIIRA